MTGTNQHEIMYNKAPFDEPKEKIIQPIGVAGDEPLSGIMGWPDPGEYLSKLEGPAAIEIFNKMRKGDPIIATGFDLIDLSLVQANWKIEDHGIEENKEPAEELAKNLFEGLARSWESVIRCVAGMKWAGFSILEPIYKDPKTVKTGPTYQYYDLAPRLQTSISHWSDEGPVQSTVYGFKTLDWNRIIIWTYRREGSGYTGVSMCRDMYKPWYLLEKIWKQVMIYFQKAAFPIPEGITGEHTDVNSEQHKQLDTLLGKLYTTENARVVHGQDVTIKSYENKEKNALQAKEIIEILNQQIWTRLYSQFLTMGTTVSGNKALSNDMIYVFQLAVTAIAKNITQTFNRMLVKPYIDKNYGEREIYPQLTVAGIEKLNLEQVEAMAKAGLLEVDKVVQAEIRSRLRLPVEKGKDGNDVKAKEHKHNLQERKKRELKWYEEFVDFDTIMRRHEKAEKQLKKEILKIRNRQVESIIKQIVAGKPNGKPLASYEIKVPLPQKMTVLMMGEYKKEFWEAARDVKNEVKKQNNLKIDIPEDRPETWTYAEGEFGDATDGANNKLVRMINAIALPLIRNGVKGSDLKNKLDESWEDAVGDATWVALAALALQTGLGDGRTHGARQIKNIKLEMYSAVMDVNTCPVCEELDGETQELGGTKWQAPNPQCLGKQRCRCIRIYLVIEEAHNAKSR